MSKAYLIIILLLSAYSINAQIRLNNPSFEDTPQDATTPRGWDACGRETTPDILPGFWGVETPAADGESYVGLITRKQNTWEYIGQTLPTPVIANQCYTIKMKLARSPSYVSYNTPVRLRIWGATTRCGREELLGKTKAVKHADWRSYSFIFVPKKTYKYIIFEAHYANREPVRGNILIDDISNITKCVRASLE